MQNREQNEGQQTDASSNTEDQALNLADKTRVALDDLPILARLRFARNYIQGNGGDKDAPPCDPGLVLVLGVLDDIEQILERNPRAANLRTIDCELG